MSDIPENANDSQDGAETFDETHTTPDGVRIAHPDTDPAVFDATRAEGDADDLIGEDEAGFDPDAAAEEDLDMLLEPGERPNEPRSFSRDLGDADHVTTEEAGPAAFESRELSDDDLDALGYGQESDEAGRD